MFIFYTLLFILHLKEYSTLSYNYEEEIKQNCANICNKYILNVQNLVFNTILILKQIANIKI